MNTADHGPVDNLSMPDATVIPVLHYPDVVAAAAWLCDAFGFVERLRIATHRVQLTFGTGAAVVVAGTAAEAPTPSGHSIMIRVPDVDEQFRRAQRAGAVVIAAPETFPYGERQCSLRDPGGHVWTFSQSVANVHPSSWGGQLVTPTSTL